jgi:glycosyltransferase involved in cell wall biosynthesis
MKLAFVSTADVGDIRKYSGTPFYMAKTFETQGIELEYINKLKTQVSLGFKTRRFLHEKFCGQEESSRFHIPAVKNYAEQIQKKLNISNADAVISHIANPLAYLDCKQPIILWTDALYAGLLGFIANFSRHSAATIDHANTLTAAALSRCRLAIFSSDWAARSAIELYGTSKEKVKVVPFGANIDCQHTLPDIHDMLKRRSPSVVKLLFLGKEWERKGGETVLNVANALHAAGQPVELHLVGSHPPKTGALADYVYCHGYVSKHDAAGVEKITRLLSESHFLFVPSRAEAFGIVFCEANAFGLPCLTSYVGGISTIVKDHINGMTFALDTNVNVYCDYIIGLMQDYRRYEELALSSFNEYQTRLNWDVATKTVKSMIAEIL